MNLIELNSIKFIYGNFKDLVEIYSTHFWLDISQKKARFSWVRFSNFTFWIFWNFCMNKIWNFASRFFHVLGKIFDFVLAKKRHFCGRKFEISNPSVENFDMNIQNLSVVQCTILISTLYTGQFEIWISNLSVEKFHMNISNPLVENFEMNITKPSVVKCAILISNPWVGKNEGLMSVRKKAIENHILQWENWTWKFQILSRKIWDEHLKSFSRKIWDEHLKSLSRKFEMNSSNPWVGKFEMNISNPK